MNTYELIKKLNDITHIDIQEEWDNSGPQLSFSKEIKKVMVTLDVNETVVNEAVENDVDMIISHHPLIFTPLKHLNDENVYDAFILKLIDNKISVYASHTNFDQIEGGNNDFLGKLFGLTDVTLLSEEESFSRKGKLDEPIAVEDFANRIADNLGLNPASIRIAKSKEDAKVQNIAWCSGDGTGFLFNAVKAGMDCFVTGDVKYHQSAFATEFGLNIIDIGHYGSEYCFIENMVAMLENLSDKDFDVIKVNSLKDPFTYI